MKRRHGSHKQFHSRDVATVVGCETHRGLRDLIGCTEPAERNIVGNQTVIHKRFRSRDVATVVEREKHHGLGNRMSCATPVAQPLLLASLAATKSFNRGVSMG